MADIEVNISVVMVVSSVPGKPGVFYSVNTFISERET